MATKKATKKSAKKSVTKKAAAPAKKSKPTKTMKPVVAAKKAKPVKKVKTTKAVKSSKPVKKVAVVSTVKKTPVESDQPSWTVIIIALLLIFLGYAVYKFYPVATVDGQVISRIRFYNNMKAQVGQTVLNNLVTEALIQSAAEKVGYKVDYLDVATKIASVEAQLATQGVTLDEALAQEGMNRDDLAREMKLQQIVEKLGVGDAMVTDAQIDEFLTQNKSSAPEGVTPEQLRDLAKTQLENQVKRENVNNWITSLKESANIQYR